MAHVDNGGRVYAGDVTVLGVLASNDIQDRSGNSLTGLVSVVSSASVNLTPSANPPSPAAEGMIYADTDHHLYYYNGTTWLQLDNAP